MLMSKLTHLFTRIAFGKNMATALTLLRLIIEALENRTIKNKDIETVSRFVFSRLPADWRQPKGPASEKEFIEMIEAGQIFLSRIQAVLSA